MLVFLLTLPHFHRYRLVKCHNCTRISFRFLCETQRETSNLPSFAIAVCSAPLDFASNPSAPFGRGRVVALYASIVARSRQSVSYGSRYARHVSDLLRDIGRSRRLILILLKKYVSNILHFPRYTNYFLWRNLSTNSTYFTIIYLLFSVTLLMTYELIINWQKRIG